jgi:hypothetical protein
MRGRLTEEGGRIIFWGVLLDLLESLSSAVGKDQYRGHRFAGGFGHGGQDSLRYPGAREPHRLCS